MAKTSIIKPYAAVAGQRGCLRGGALTVGLQDLLLGSFSNQRRYIQLSTQAPCGERCSAGFWDHRILEVIILLTPMDTCSLSVWLPSVTKDTGQSPSRHPAARPHSLRGLDLQGDDRITQVIVSNALWFYAQVRNYS